MCRTSNVTARAGRLQQDDQCDQKQETIWADQGSSDPYLAIARGRRNYEMGNGLSFPRSSRRPEIKHTHAHTPAHGCVAQQRACQVVELSTTAGAHSAQRGRSAPIQGSQPWQPWPPNVLLHVAHRKVEISICLDKGIGIEASSPRYRARGTERQGGST